MGTIKWMVMINFCIFSILSANGYPLLSAKDNYEWNYEDKSIVPLESDQVSKRSPRSMPLFDEEELRTAVIVPVMNIMGLGLSVFGNLYPTRQLRNDDGSQMNSTELKQFRNQMSVFHSRFSELGAHLTGLVNHGRALKQPFHTLGKKMVIGRLFQEQERKMTQFKQT